MGCCGQVTVDPSLDGNRMHRVRCILYPYNYHLLRYSNLSGIWLTWSRRLLFFGCARSDISHYRLEERY
jgi:hypothetical protein